MSLGAYHGPHLPHVDNPEMIQHVTWHLADSIPAEARDRLEATMAADPEQARRERYQTLLDNGCGSCVLRRPEVATMVCDSLRCFDGDRYRLHAWVVMPNHVHVLVGVRESAMLARIVQSWKSFTARRINDLTGSRGPVWHRDYWDRYIRDGRHYEAARAYIRSNPAKAGLVGWPWVWELGTTSSSSS